ncbi:MAG: hypothetical protein H0V82_00260 [Candidatus Protochlamydia sp.]|nr:hypothetical protein [Candidatus Protochlamydia sp.]
MVYANLEEIKILLESKLFKCEVLAPSEQMPLDQLVVSLDPDYLNQPRLLIIRSTPRDLSVNDELIGITSEKRKYCEIHLIAGLPFQIGESYIADTARFILLLNKGMELPGFELSEVDRLIFFRHAFVVPENDLDERILFSLVGMVQVLLEAFSESLEAVAIGKQSLRETLDQVQQMINAGIGSNS